MHTILVEKMRISGFSRTVPGKILKAKLRMNIINVESKEYTTEPMIKQILHSYEFHLKKDGINLKTLIVCHGHRHPSHAFLPIKNSLLLDINPACVPDILGDMRNPNFMKRLPAEYFDVIYLVYCPPPSPVHARNHHMWMNLKRLIKPNGKIISNYVFGMYFRKLKRRSREELQNRIKADFKPYFSRISFDKAFTIMSK